MYTFVLTDLIERKGITLIWKLSEKGGLLPRKPILHWNLPSPGLTLMKVAVSALLDREDVVPRALLGRIIDLCQSFQTGPERLSII